MDSGVSQQVTGPSSSVGRQLTDPRRQADYTPGGDDRARGVVIVLGLVVICGLVFVWQGVSKTHLSTFALSTRPTFK
jgi:hypothetical protein